MPTDLSHLVELLEPLRALPALAAMTSEALCLAGEFDDVTAYLSESLPIVAQATQVDYAVVLTPEAGDWKVLGSAGSRQRLPLTWFAEALER